MLLKYEIHWGNIRYTRGNKLKVNEEIKRSWGEGSIAHDLLDAILNED